jgi:hypothetical protein
VVKVFDFFKRSNLLGLTRESEKAKERGRRKKNRMKIG